MVPGKRSLRGPSEVPGTMVPTTGGRSQRLPRSPERAQNEENRSLRGYGTQSPSTYRHFPVVLGSSPWVPWIPRGRSPEAPPVVGTMVQRQFPLVQWYRKRGQRHSNHGTKGSTSLRHFGRGTNHGHQKVSKVT